MARRLIIIIFGLALRIFFRRLEIVGVERVPRNRPVMFITNHPNALIDPAVLLCLAPRRVSFLAKAPIFKMPVIGSLARAMEALPVYRRQDKDSHPEQNRATFRTARDLLKRGGTIAICPEGVSHNEPHLLPLKSGAARIALGAVSAGERRMELEVVPVGLYYTAKAKFRSAALLYYGQPFTVAPTLLDANGEPPESEVDALTARLEQALRQVMLDAENEEAAAAVRRAETIFSSAEETVSRQISLEKELRRQQRFLAGYAYHRQHSPARIEALEERLLRYEEDLAQVGLNPQQLMPPDSARAILLKLLRRLMFFVLLAIPAALGLVLHYPAYLLIDLIVMGFLKKDAEDMVATVKLLAALLFFPLTWLILAFLTGWFYSWAWAVVVFLVTPFTGWAAVRFFEKLDNFFGGCRALVYFVTRRWYFVRLMAERQAIREEILDLAAEANLSPEVLAK